ncbi:thioredoxin family protein [Colwelliaceae bacterium BS250]
MNKSKLVNKANSEKNSDVNQIKKGKFMRILVKYKALLMLLAFTLWFLAAIVSSNNANAEESPSYAVGVVSKQTLLENYQSFTESYDTYQVSAEERQAIAQLPQALTIKVFFGTWCHDSEREVPRLLKAFNKHANSIELIALDYNKSEPLGVADKAKIKFTPTFVIYNNNIEIGRIIERPQISLAEDILELYSLQPTITE